MPTKSGNGTCLPIEDCTSQGLTSSFSPFSQTLSNRSKSCRSGSRHHETGGWLAQLQATTALHRRQTVNGLEASQLRSQPEHPPHSCSGEPAVRPGEGLERLREPGRPGRHTSTSRGRVSQSWRQAGHWRGQMSTSHQEKALSPQFHAHPQYSLACYRVEKLNV